MCACVSGECLILTVVPQCLPRVKEVDDIDAEVALEPVDVHVGAVQHLDIGIISVIRVSRISVV